MPKFLRFPLIFESDYSSGAEFSISTKKSAVVTSLPIVMVTVPPDTLQLATESENAVVLGSLPDFSFT